MIDPPLGLRGKPPVELYRGGPTKGYSRSTHTEDHFIFARGIAISPPGGDPAEAIKLSDHRQVARFRHLAIAYFPLTAT
jgi:hypothetical protein